MIRIDGGPPGTPGIFWEIPGGNRPNRFHSWMLRLAFGWRITRDVEDKGGEVVPFTTNHRQ